jgi:hypothetical protein
MTHSQMPSAGAGSQTAARLPKARPGPLLYWQPLAGAVVFMLAVVIGATVAVTRSRAAAAPSVQESAYAILPPAPIESRPALLEMSLAKADCKACLEPLAIASAAKPNSPRGAAAAGIAKARRQELPIGPGKEAFGTAVQFERNLPEALDLARRERKLVFVLHVSGNFEEQEFT